MNKKNLEYVERYTAGERVLHWIMALSFLYAFLSGLAIAFPSFHWMLTILGGKEFARWFHPWAGLIFTISFFLFIPGYIKEIQITEEDKVFLKNMKYYLAGEHEKLPEVGMLNAGQKLYAWTLIIGAILFLLSGIPMWFPQKFGAVIARFCVLIHELAFIAVGAFAIIHMYMGIFGMKGAIWAVLGGKVSAEWAKTHHSKWYKEKLSS